MEDSFQDAVRSLQIQCGTLRPLQRACCFPTSDERCTARIPRRLRSYLPQRCTNLLRNCLGAQMTRSHGSGETTASWPLCQTGEVSILSSRSGLPGIPDQPPWSTDGPEKGRSSNLLAHTAVPARHPSLSRIRQLLQEVHQ